MDLINLNYINIIKEFYTEYIDLGVLDSIFIRGSLANNQFNNKISDIDLIIFYTDKRSMDGFVNRFENMCKEKFLVKPQFDILYFHINDILSYNIIYVLKYKSKLWLGKKNILQYIYHVNIRKEDLPYNNVNKITSLLDPVIDSEILKIYTNIDLTHIKTSPRHTVGLIKRIIRSVYEYLYLTKQIVFISFSCDEICYNIINSNVEIKWKNILKECSRILEKCKNDYFYVEKNTETILDLYKKSSNLFKEKVIQTNIKKLYTDPQFNYFKKKFQIKFN